MKSRRSSDFRAAFNKLPPAVQQQARAAYARFKDDPSYPGLHFKRVHPTAPLWSVRIGIHYRAVGVMYTDVIIWIWIGLHPEYDKFIAQF